MGASVQCAGDSASDPNDIDIGRCGRSCGGGSQTSGFGEACIPKPCCAGDEADIIPRANTAEFQDMHDGRIVGIYEDGSDPKSDKGSLIRPVPMIQSTREERATSGECELNYFERENDELVPLQSKGENPGAIYRFKSGAVYYGEWTDGMRHGFGKMVWADGVCYEGQWDSNAASGRGSFQHLDGDQYIGEWGNSMANGKGVYYHEGVQTYLGDWEDDFQHGSGIESWSEGAWYEGEFNKSQKEGYGRYRWEGGCEYLGRWTNNVIGGYGMCIATDGRLFMGMWRQSAMHGTGKYIWPDGKEYTGQYWFDKKDGFGVLKEVNGEVFTRFWTRGAPDSSVTGKSVPLEVSPYGSHLI